MKKISYRNFQTDGKTVQAMHSTHWGWSMEVQQLIWAYGKIRLLKDTYCNN